MKTTLLAAVLLCVLSTGISVEASTWTIPGIANAYGANNTHFVSDLAITNPGNASVITTLSFLPTGLPAIDVSIGAGQTVAYRNILDQLWGVTSAGAVQVTSDSALLIRARTYNNASAGTYGVALPVFADDQLLSLGDTADSVWVSQSADYRTNIGVVFPDEGGGSASVTIYDAEGNEVGTRDYGVDAAGFQQLSVATFGGAVPVGRAEIVVTRGRAAGYSVVVDNVTGDSSLFTFEDLPAGYQDVVVNGVARANGRNGTFFRTDGRFYNPTSQDATITVAYHAYQNSNPSPVVGTFIVPAGKIRDVVDVLGSLLALPTGSAGALRFSSETPLAIACRTSNVDPAGINPGTFGAQQKPTQLILFLSSADGSAVITGIRQNSSFRTNLGFTAGADGAAYTLTLQSTSGATLGTTTGSLGTFGFAQPNVQDLFPGTAIEDAKLLVKVTSGSVDVYDSSIDNVSGDSVVTPIMRVPIDLPSSATIGPDGGSIRSSDGILTLKIPAGALSAPVPISLTLAPNGAPHAVGSGYDLSPGGLAFAKPALLIFRYGRGGVYVPAIDSMSVAFASGTSWIGVTGGRIDTAARTLTISLANTTPSQASALPVTQATHAASGTSRAVLLEGLYIGLLPTWVPTDGKAEILAYFRLPPSASGGESATVLISELDFKVKLIVFPPKIGTITPKSVDQFIYTAPHGIAHASLPVKLRVRSPAINNAFYEATRIVHVIRRRWSLNVEFKLNVACVEGSGNEDFSYSYADDQTQNFRLGDDLSLTADPFLGGLPADAVVTSCKCATTMMSKPGTLTFNLSNDSHLTTVEADALFHINGTAEIANMLPPIQRVCPNPVPPPATITYTDDPASFSFDLFLGLLGNGGLAANDGVAEFKVDEPPLLKVVIQWHSIPE
jgi:hypothetical protein